MTDEAKLGLVAGILAVVGVAVFGQPKEAPRTLPKPVPVVSAPVAPPVQLPAGVAPDR
ncbi:MAG: hypothetical protein KF873_11675 [Gemmataceae bacterium]|nr:hypothetical protein [Planctomycetia bacterium]MBX3399395.1 hypothetical protein [Gemmataceae bacterium]